jgi:eukaryotic-like serine/threonine-protein kinase
MPKTCPVCSTTYPDSDAFCPKDGSTLRLDDGAASLVGSVIADRYLVSRLLGEGGMGQVYLAGHVRLPQQAAIKVLHASMVKDSGAIARFNREAANAARIEHERVARVFDFGETSDGLVYLAMEFVPGRTLRELLEEHGRLEPIRAANILYQVAEGLDAAHRINIVHRDLKPDNVLVVTDEQGLDKCKVVDFGIAKALNDSDNKKTQLTQVGAIIGTPEYMSPEQVLGEAIDARSDVYALAVVAFHLLTGTLPFSAATPERTLTARLISKPLTLREAAPEIDWPASMQTAFDQAMEGDPSERTPTALIFAETLVSAVEEWTGSGVLRGRTPLSVNVVPTPTVARLVSEAAAEHVMRKAPTVAVSAPASAMVAAAAKAAPAPAAAPTAAYSAAPSSADVTTAARSTNGAAPSATRSPVALVGGLLVVAAAIGFFALKGGDDAAAPTAATSAVADAGAAPTAPSESGTAGQGAAPTSAAVNEAGQASGAAGNAGPGGGTTGSGAAPDAGPATVIPAERAPEPAPGATDGAAAADRAAALRTLDSLVRAVADATPATASLAVPKFTAVLPRLGTASDSTRAYIQLALMHYALENEIPACSALRAAKRLMRTDGQIEMVQMMQAEDFFAKCP